MRTAAVAIALVLCGSGASAFENGRAAFSVAVNDVVVPYRVFAVFALPGETLNIAVRKPLPGEMTLIDGDRRLPGDAAAWSWKAPDTPGVVPLVVSSAGEEILLNVVVMHPASAVVDGHLGTYRIGRYPAKPLNGDPVYRAPPGYIELNEDTQSLQLSPHFRLSQFPSKQASAANPKYLVLREELLLKLELLLEEVNRRGIAAETLTIMSGYRTPYYNAAIGNVPNSRHVYGGAADLYVDVAPVDDVMDDLNGDGKSNYVDAQVLYRWANALFRKPENRHLAGGLGVYRRNAAHGPFLHIDARGQRARWGLVP